MSRPRTSRLADPIRLGPLTVRNRIVFAAHLTNATVDRLPSAQHAAYYAARAEGGAGLVITEEQSASTTDRPYEKLVDGTDPAVVPGYRRIVEAVHAHGAAVVAQIGHNGGQSSLLYSRTPVDGPSPVPDPMFREVPRALDDAGIAALVDGFATVAAHCAAGGFDGVEIQCSQASVIRQFLSPLTNQRTDRWADGLTLLDAVIHAVREAIGGGRALGVRLQGDEGLAGGLRVSDAVVAARRIAPSVDWVNTSIGVATATLPLIEPPMGVPAGYAAWIPSAVRTALAADGSSVPVIGVGRFTTPEAAEVALTSGSCDLVGVVRGQIADPAFASKALAGERVRRCVGCNQECIARVGANQRLGCAVNPRAGWESVGEPGPPDRRRRVLVVGGGPAGLAAASTAADRGHDVHLVERELRLGGQVALAAAAPGRAELNHVVSDLAAELAARPDRVRVSLGVEAGPALVAADDPDVVVLATGSLPSPPAWAGPDISRPDITRTDISRTDEARSAGSRVVDVSDVLVGRVAPVGRVVVVDEAGGATAASAAPVASVAELLARRGCAVTVVTAAMVAVGGLGPTLERGRWRRRAVALGIVVETGRVVLGASGEASGPVLDVLHHPTGERSSVPADWVVRSGPRRAHVPTVGAPGLTVVTVGDAVAPRGIAEAIREGTAAGQQ